MRSLVFPELPLLDLIPGVAFSDQPELGRKVRRSKAYRTWHNSGKTDAKSSLELASYSNNEDGLSIAQLTATLSGYFDRAKKGDLVVVPPKAYSQDCLIGEFVSDPTIIRRFNVERYGDDYLTGRDVS